MIGTVEQRLAAKIRDEPVAAKVARIVECRIVKGRCVTHQRPDDERPACPFVDALLREAGAS